MAKLEFESIVNSIKKREFAPIYVLMGEEPFFIDQITNMLIDLVVPENERDFNQTILYGADTDGITILNAARRYPMMAEKQLVVVREAQMVNKLDALTEYAKKPLESTVLVLCHKYKTLDRRKAFTAAIEKHGVVFESKKIPEYNMGKVINSMVQNYTLTIDSKATQMMVDFLGNDLSRINKELDKLSIIMSEKGLKRITDQLIEEHIGMNKDFNNFELLNAIIVKDVLKANRIINYFGKDPKNHAIQVTLAVLFNYFSNLLICYYTKDKSTTNLTSILGLRSTRQANDYLTGLRNFPPMKVFNLIHSIRLADAYSKGVDTPALSDEEILKELVYKIIH